MFKHGNKLLSWIGSGLLRRGSDQFRAASDLFDESYDKQVGWQSGLGNGGFLLYSLVRCLYPEVVVEIGSARGKSTCCMALACRQNSKGKVYAIDPHIMNDWTERGTTGDNEHFLRSRLQAYGLERHCDVIRAGSTEAARSWDRPIDLMFIDGDHSYEGVKQDFELFQPWFTERALVVFHDTTWDYPAWERAKESFHFTGELGVPPFLEEIRQLGYPSITFPALPGITIVDPHIGGSSFLEGKGWPFAATMVPHGTSER